MNTYQQELFEIRPSRRKLNRKEKKLVYLVLRWYLYRDVPAPTGDGLVIIKEALEKLKPLRGNKK